MSTSNSRQSYEDCYELMDNALSAGIGVRVGFSERGEAMYLRTRLNHARTLDRNFNGERYETSDPRRNASDYDVLVFRVRYVEGRHWVYIEKKRIPELVEEIREGEGAESLGPIREIASYRRF